MKAIEIGSGDDIACRISTAEDKMLKTQRATRKLWCEEGEPVMLNSFILIIMET